MNRSIVQRFSSGVLWTVVGNVAAKVFTAASAILLARILGPKGFGEYGLVLSTVLLFSTYGAFRLGSTCTKHVAQYRRSEPVRAARILKLGLTVSFCLCAIISVVFLAASPAIARHSLGRPEMAGTLAIGTVLLFLMTYGGILQQALTGFENYRSIAVLTVVRGVLTLALCVPLAWYAGVPGALIGASVAAAVLLPMSLGYLRRERRMARMPDRVPLASTREEWPVLWQFALPGFLVLAIMSLGQWLARVIIARREDGLSALGVFEAAGQWTLIVHFLPLAMTRVILPILSDGAGRNDEKDFRAAFSLHFSTILCLVLPLSILLITASGFLVRVYGDAYRAAAAILPLLALSSCVRTLNDSLRVVCESRGRQWPNFAFYFLSTAVFLGSTLVLAPRAAVGLALASVFGELALFLALAAYVNFSLVPRALLPHLPLLLMTAALTVSMYFAVRLLPETITVPAGLVLTLVGAVPLLERLNRARRVLPWPRENLRPSWLHK